MKIGIVAGEASGDYLAAGLIRELRKLAPDVEVVGIGGPLMRAEGARLLFPMDTISIMGVDGLAQSLWKILRIRRSIQEFLESDPPDVFVGVDVPDFNLTLERRLKSARIPVVHYVSPTVWAWRGYRIRKIRRSVDMMLTLFPFEETYYRERSVPVAFVGHPMADEIPRRVDRRAAREKLDVAAEFVIALMPGSRTSELKRLGRLFVDVASNLNDAHPGKIRFLAPFVSEATRDCFRDLVATHAPELQVEMLSGGSRKVLAASDLVLLASGTAALEAALFRVPMVVTYKVSWFTGVMVRLFARVKYFSMPNNLLDDPVVPELLQEHATVDEVTRAMEKYIGDAALRRETEEKLSLISESLRQGANVRAAGQVMKAAGLRPNDLHG